MTAVWVSLAEYRAAIVPKVEVMYHDLDIIVFIIIL